MSIHPSMSVQAQREMIMMNENMKYLGGSNENLLPIIYNNNNRSVNAICVDDSGSAGGMERSRKRCRDDINSYEYDHDHDPFRYFIQNQHQQHQLELDRLISLHNEKVRLDIEERRKKEGRWMIGILEEAAGDHVLMKTILKRKDEEIENIGKLNWALEERVKCLFMENQILRELAETSEATANALRANLQHQLLILAHHHETTLTTTTSSTDHDHDIHEAESCCNADNMNMTKMNDHHHRVCKCCGEMESCVLLLPCRHLSLCTVCGSSVHVCPVCNSPKTASVHVNFSNS